MKRKRSLVLSSIFLSLLLALTGCGGAAGGDLMAGVRPRKTGGGADWQGPGADAYAELGLELLRRAQEAQPGEGVLASPLSVLSALTMTAGGASGETLAQLEAAMGLPADQLREWIAAYSSGLPDNGKASLHQANSIWLREGAVKVEKDFLQQNADYFSADVYQKSFDGTTLEELNDWVKENTHGMIPQILSELKSEAMLVLLNALAFEGEWESVYDENAVREKLFTLADGTETQVDMMFSSEGYYLRDGEAAGFLKPYAGGEYAFAALLPPEGQCLSDYLAGLTGQRLRAVLAGAQKQEVLAGLPRFEAEYSARLDGLLQEMGVTDAFDPARADLSRMGKTEDGMPLYISQIVHKTYLSVFEQGTKAGAATAVVAEAGSALPDELPQVYLDRPFLYMIVDTETYTPVFIGTMENPA